MVAGTQYKLSAGDLDVILALARSGNLAGAGERLGVDASTVFRSIRRIERGLE
ncbi:MAG: LysR family transcriptional regulator, partial [Burkholderiaceae bacterium]